jgi:methylmalonyl-CoA/ethylmalonyl-CoA epimerase
MKQPFFTGTSQVAIVVKDLDASMRVYVEEYGIGPWKVFEFNPRTAGGMTVDEQPVEYAMRVGTTLIGDTEWELIEPLDHKSIYAQHLAAHGEGLHHVSMKTRDDYDEALAELRAKGHIARQGGSYEGATFVYMSTDRDLGVITELVKWPEGTVHTPDRIYPPEAADEA